MINTVNVKTYTDITVDMNEILRYAQCFDCDNKVANLVRELLKECGFSYKLCYREFPVEHSGDSIDLGFYKTNSRSLEKLLEKCDRVVLFAATIGFDIDRRITKFSKIDPAKALILQAIGTERIESLCDAFQEDLKRENGYIITHRFSPGYADLPLDMQKEVFRVLNCYKNIGVTLNDSLLMSPSKSVTAIIGIQG